MNHYSAISGQTAAVDHTVVFLGSAAMEAALSPTMAVHGQPSMMKRTENADPARKRRYIGGEMLRCHWQWLQPREDPVGQIGGGGRLHLLWLRGWQREPGEVADGQRLQTIKRRLRLLLLQWRWRESREASHGESLLLLRRGRKAGEVPDGNRRMMMGVGHGQR